jgi:Flp pilus assembly protein TadG
VHVRGRRSSLRARAPRRAPGERSPERGQALAELAIVITLMLVLALAVFDLGLAFYRSMLLVQGARDGARVAMDCGASAADIHAAALAAAPAGSTAAVSPARAACPTNMSSGVTTTVTVSYTHSWITPFWGGVGTFAMQERAYSR